MKKTLTRKIDWIRKFDFFSRPQRAQSKEFLIKKFYLCELRVSVVNTFSQETRITSSPFRVIDSEKYFDVAETFTVKLRQRRIRSSRMIGIISRIDEVTPIIQRLEVDGDGDMRRHFE